MKKGILIKVIACAIVCAGFAVVCEHMPQFMRAVYDSIFQMVDFPTFMFVMGVFVFEILLLRRWGRDHKWHYVCFCIAFIISSSLLFYGHSSLYDKLEPGSNTTLLERATSGKDLPQGVFTQYYFGDKKLIMPEGKSEYKEKLPYIFKFSVPDNKIVENKETIVSEELCNKLFTNPYFFNGDNCYFVVDPYWENAINVKMMEAGGYYLFCSQDFLEINEELIFGNSDDDAVSFLRLREIEQGEALNDNTVSYLRNIEQSRPYKKFKQVAVMLLLLITGLIFSLPVWGKDYPILGFFLGLPLIVASICIYGIILMILNIPYNLWSISIGCCFFAGIWIYKYRNIYKKMDWQLILNFLLAAFGVIVFLVYAEICFTSHDSIAKCALAYRLAKYGTIRDILAYVTPYGMLEPMIISIGYMTQCDLLYTLYPLMAISGMGVMYAGICYSNKQRDKNIAILVLGYGIILLLSNYDFLLSCFYVMSHGIMAVYMLIFVIFIVLKREINIPWFAGTIIMVSAVILLTRVEGAIYILFMLIASIGIENDYLKMKKSNIILITTTIIWNLYQMIYAAQVADSYFWSPDRGILLIGVSIAVLIVTLIMDRRWKVLNHIRERYFILLMAAITGMTVLVAVFWKRGMAIANLPVYIAHFSNSVKNGTNSAALWIFVFLLSPVIINMRKRENEYAITIVLGYIIFLFAIFLFRSDGSLGGGLPLSQIGRAHV